MGGPRNSQSDAVTGIRNAFAAMEQAHSDDEATQAGQDAIDWANQARSDHKKDRQQFVDAWKQSR